MKPAAAEIERETRVIEDRPCPPAEPAARLEEKRVDAGAAQPTRRRYSCRAAADDRYLDIAARHSCRTLAGLNRGEDRILSGDLTIANDRRSRAGNSRESVSLTDDRNGGKQWASQCREST